MPLQGNMNSDNSALSGITLDYGPFAFMEKFSPLYNSWVGGGMPYSFGRQPQAAAVNLAGLSAPFIELVELVGKEEGLSPSEVESSRDEIRGAVSHGFVDSFHSMHDANCRAKLGFASWDAEAEALWSELFGLMSSRCGKAGIDFTLLFRSLCVPPPTAGGEGSLLDTVRPAAFEDVEKWPADHREEWEGWLRKYFDKVAADDRSESDRLAEMKNNNPKYILRNWMAKEAYEAAARGDCSIVRELLEVLTRPYDEQSDKIADRWGGLTPEWARDRAGLAYMS